MTIHVGFKVACKEDRAFPRDLLKRRNASPERASGEMLDMAGSIELRDFGGAP
jgi:hypothetical protein